MSDFYARYPVTGGGVPIYANFAAFPVSAPTGSLGVDASTGDLYEFNGTSWVLIAHPNPGSVTSVGLADNTGLFTISGSPVTTTGTLTLASLNNQAANSVFAGPASGSAASPSFRALVSADIPDLSAIYANTALSNLSLTSINQNLTFNNSGPYTISPADITNIHGQSLTINAGNALNSGSNGSGGNLNLNGGNYNPASGTGFGGNVNITGGAGYDRANGAVTIAGGSSSNGTTPGGAINLNGGTGTSSGGGIAIIGGDGFSGLGTGGSITIAGGASTVDLAGAIQLQTQQGLSSVFGLIQFQNGSEGTAGQVWTSIDTSGSGSWQPANIGTVTSVGLVDSTGLFTISGSPVTSSGNLTLASLNAQTQNSVFAGPSTGGAGTPSFRALVSGDIPDLSATYVTQSEVGASNGVASLDASGKVPSSELPSTVLQYEGLWNPSTNTPLLQDSTGTNGFVYQVSVAFAGPIIGLNNATMVNFQIGNLVIYSSAVNQWEQTTPAAGVSSVNGAQGAVSLSVSSINGFAGTYSGTALTLSTTVTGVLKGNGTAISAATAGTDYVIPSGSITGTAGNITATSNSTLTTLSALSLPGSQVTGNISGNAANITATSNSTLTTLSALSLPGSQVTGNISGNAANVTGIVTVPNGGTGLAALTTGNVILGAGTSTPTFVAPGTSGNVLTSNGSTWLSQASASSFVIPTVQIFSSGSGTYTLPTSPRAPLYIRVTMVGAGGGGSGSSTPGANNAGNGGGGSSGNTTFGSNIAGGGGGAQGLSTLAGGTGGTVTLAAGFSGVAVNGGNGNGNYFIASTSASMAGNAGASSALGGSGGSRSSAISGSAGTVNTGGGGAGGGGNNTGSLVGGGGGSGAYICAITTSAPSSTYSYSVGTGGAGGTAGTSGAAGTAGGSGLIVIEEFYQ